MPKYPVHLTSIHLQALGSTRTFVAWDSRCGEGIKQPMTVVAELRGSPAPGGHTLGIVRAHFSKVKGYLPTEGSCAMEDVMSLRNLGRRGVRGVDWWFLPRCFSSEASVG